MGDRLNETLEFDYGLFKKIVNATKPRCVHFLGGEPLLWPHINEAILFCWEKGIKCSLCSNLILITNKQAKNFFSRKVEILGKLNIGDLEDKEEQKIQAQLIGAGTGTVKKLTLGIKKVEKAGYKAPLFCLGNFVRKQNVHLVQEFLEFCKKNKIKPILEVSCKGMDLSKKEIQSIIKQTGKVYAAKKIILPHFTHACQYYNNSLYFRPTGDIQACSGNSSVLANFLKDKNALKKALSHKIIKNRKRVSKKLKPECIGCRARAENEGNLTGQDPLIEFI